MPQQNGLRYVPNGFGKFEFRVREQHVANHLIPLITKGAGGAAKLDLVLRGAALLPEYAGGRKPGAVLYGYSYERLHDLSRPASIFGDYGSDADTPPEVVAKKRKWVGEQLDRLEDLKLVKRVERKGRRPYLFVMCDDGNGGAFDDPDGLGDNSYVRILGPLIARRKLAAWGAPELSAYLAAMTAERWADSARNFQRAQPGTGTWFRPLAWFGDVERYGPKHRVALPFATRTLERGMVALEKQGLIAREKTTAAPFSNRRLSGPRVVYRNRFFDQADIADLVDDDLVREEERVTED